MQLTDGILSISIVRHGDEGEPFAAVRGFVHDNVDVPDGAVWAKQSPEVKFLHFGAKVEHKEDVAGHRGVSGVALVKPVQ